MNKVSYFFEKHRWSYVLAVFCLSLITFGTYLTFTFWKDDWFLLWSALYNLQAMHQYWVHPGTVVEFMWLTKLFGTNALWWQLWGLSLHVGVALALYTFATAITDAPSVGMLSGIFYSVSVIGMDAVGWPSAHVVLISAIFLLTGMTHFVRYLRDAKEKWMILAMLYIGIGFLFDPFRNFPVFFMFPAVFLIVSMTKRQHDAYVRFLEILLLSFVTLSIFTFGVFTKDILGSEFFKHLLAVKSPVDILKKTYVVGNYFNSLANLMFGWLFRFPEDASTGVYNRFVARVGFLVFCIAGGVGYRYVKTKAKASGIILFLFLWTAIFYIPNWLFEPRLTMGVTHRYMVLSGLGFVILLAYFISLLKDRVLQILLTISIMALNMGTAKYYITIASQYRSTSLINSLWNTIEKDSPQSDNLIFVYEGQDPVKTYALGLSGSSPFGLMRHISDVYNLPIVTDDKNLIQKLLCFDNTSRVEPGSLTVQKEIIPLNHVFAWSVTNTGTLTSITLPTRKALLISAMATGCVPAIDRAAIKENK